MSFCYLCRERPKYPVKEDPDTPINGLRGVGEASGTVKVARDGRSEDTIRAGSVKLLDYHGLSFYD